MTTNAQVAHAWAHQTGHHRKSTNGNLYYDGDTIYSYGAHFPIARIVENAKGAKAVLFTTRTYSITTSAHCSDVRGALGYVGNALYPMFSVELPTSHVTPEALRTEYQRKADAFFKSLPRLRAYAPGSDAFSQFDDPYRDACKFFGFRYRPLERCARVLDLL